MSSSEGYKNYLKDECLIYLCLQLASLHSTPYIFFAFGTTHHPVLCTYLFDVVSSNKDKVILINLSANIILLILINLSAKITILLVLIYITRLSDLFW